ncbi:helix-turn-helix domain-containing protein [Proteus mirabilis]|nr:helix-turn-helix domain-containing protein [Proteus mirabilis]UXJ01222.1 helix-turn-helix domain-containing protein [Proteus mirabilis]
MSKSAKGTTERHGRNVKAKSGLNRNMKRLQAFKFQLRPNGQQEREMRRFAGACRFVFNRALARQNESLLVNASGKPLKLLCV